MLMSDSDLPPSPTKPKTFETLVESSSIRAQAVQSLALSSPNRDQNSPSPLHGSSSFFSLETITLSSPISLDHDTPRSRDKYETESWDSGSSYRLTEKEKPWKLYPSRRYDTDDDDVFEEDEDSNLECRQPLLLKYKQEPVVVKTVEPVTGVGAGIWNLGNSCFLNSVLQCLTHTVPLVESLRSYKYQRPCYCGNEEFCVIRQLRCHIEFALMKSRYPISPLPILNNLNYFSPDFRRFQQEDAHEFLQAFLDKLERCCLDRRSHHGSMSSSQDVNIVENVFGGRLVSMLRCCNCNSVSETFESSVGLSLEIEDVDNLHSALESFTRVEKLDEQLTCDSCKEKVSKEKQLLLDKLPLVATFHLKRFQNNGYFMEKLFKHISIPLELDLQPYMRESHENKVPTKYHLYAFVEHLGISSSYGHYSSYVRSAPKIWHQFDDVKVTRIDEDSVRSEDSYILFYAREGTPWFSRSYEEMQPLLEASLLNSSPQSVLDPTNGECLSEISYENVDKSNKPCGSVGGVSNPRVKTGENCISISNETNEDVFSAECSGEDSPLTEFPEPLETDDSSSPCTEKKPDHRLAIKNQDLFLKKQERTVRVRLEHLETTKNDDEPLVGDDVADSIEETGFPHRELMKKQSPRARELGQTIANTSSPPKRIKTGSENENV